MKRWWLIGGILTAAALGYGQNNNCSSATQICNDANFSGNSGGFGVQELPNNNTIDGCLTIEHQSSWYYFQPVTSGTIALTIQTSVDYDFAIWQSGNCNSLGSPVRCSYAATTGNTGLAATNSSGQTVNDVSEGTGGDRWVMPLNVTAGQVYIMLIDNFTANSTPFTLDWTFTNGATLNCAPLGVSLVDFTAEYRPAENANILSWRTVAERFNDHFTVERSTQGSSWQVIHLEPGAQQSDQVLHYSYADGGFEAGKINYYRLSQTDSDGTQTVFPIITVDNRQSEKTIVKVCNTMGQEVSPDTKGIVILLYEDGTTRRVFRD
jgi:hypothetical protein